MRKISGILLLTCLIAPLLGYYIFLQTKKYQVKKETQIEISSEIFQDKFVLLVFSMDEKNNLKWEHEHEFEYKGQMYDIVDVQTRGDSVYYTCFKDIRETNINKQINDLMTRAMGTDQQKNENQKRLINFIKIQYLPQSDSWNPSIITVENSFAYFIEQNHNTIFHPPPLPPPKSV